MLRDEPQVWDGVGEGDARGRGKEFPANAGGAGSNLGLGRSPEEGKGNPFLPGKSHGYWNLAGYSLWFCKQWDMGHGSESLVGTIITNRYLFREETLCPIIFQPKIFAESWVKILRIKLWIIHTNCFSVTELSLHSP